MSNGRRDAWSIAASPSLDAGAAFRDKCRFCAGVCGPAEEERERAGDMSKGPAFKLAEGVRSDAASGSRSSPDEQHPGQRVSFAGNFAGFGTNVHSGAGISSWKTQPSCRISGLTQKPSQTLRYWTRMENSADTVSWVMLRRVFFVFFFTG